MDPVPGEFAARPPMITGATRMFVIIGDPIAQVRSPLFYNRRLAAMGADAILAPWHAPAAHFKLIMSGLMQTANVHGIVVTYPFKHLAFGRATRLTAAAKRISAVNALRRESDGSWTGGMFDGEGLVRAARQLLSSLNGLRVGLLGAGGAGSAIAYSLAEAGVAQLSIHDLDHGKAEKLAFAVAAAVPSCRCVAVSSLLDHPGLLINATPVGLHPGDGLPAKSLANLRPSTAVIDIVMRPEGTELLNLARRIGALNIDGAAMVEGQAESVLEFFGVRSDERGAAA